MWTLDNKDTYIIHTLTVGRLFRGPHFFSGFHEFFCFTRKLFHRSITYISIPMKPYIKGQYWMITTIPLDDNYFLVVIIQLEL